MCQHIVTVYHDQADATLSSSRFTAVGKHYDEDDLKDKFGHKPQQLEAIIRNAPKIWHPQRECYMWTVDEFESTRFEEDRNEALNQKTIKQDEDKWRKAEKAPKPKKEPVGPKPKKLTVPQKKKLAKLAGQAGELKTAGLELQRRLGEDLQLQGFVPQALAASLQDVLTKLASETVALAIALGDDWDGVFDSCKGPAEEIIKETTEIVNRVQLFAAEFDKMTAPTG